jgi:hypothetical protein
MPKRSIVAGVLALALLTAAAFAAIASGGSSTAAPTHNHAAAVSRAEKAEELRVALNRLLGEHALLAVQATQRGYSGGKDFPALAQQVDRNSIELSKAIGSVFGAKAGRQFLNGKFLWRAHIGFFVDYTVAKAKRDPAGQRKAVNNLKIYTGTFSKFLADATGLPQPALQKSIAMHVAQLKGALDSYASGNYRRSYRLERDAYHHMGMTADVLAAAIAKKQSR